MPEEKVSRFNGGMSGYVRTKPPTADAEPRHYVSVERSLLEGILNFMNRRFDGDRLLKHQAHFIGELHRVLDPPVPQEPSETLKQMTVNNLPQGVVGVPQEAPVCKVGSLRPSGYEGDCECVAGRYLVAPDWAMQVADELVEDVVRQAALCGIVVNLKRDDHWAALIRQAGSERERKIVERCAQWLEREGELFNQRNGATLRIAAKGLRAEASRVLVGE